MKAASEGRVLVLEGIEKAERNVLPVLNNLLENREMHLEDGRLLIPASRYILCTMDIDSLGFVLLNGKSACTNRILGYSE